ncbi:alpha/beta hydrolase [Streptomyces sp. ALI-76-A]|uniref:alpha/beta fold hydrolase n=1 Tax=Streptomyces sp. ALI-76-A TaxID=3025736 RepID=UPI00256F3E69|nr:alpha/beta hydrolase [Streptomyces sp. ALI-76-A]MDL5203809.1 alpha/beta hydrolase [Streptomyces sp. ALI-76-A]
MPFFSSYDGTVLAYHVAGDGAPVVCLPGGPTDSAYLGDLGGLSAHRQVIRLDLRGTGRSAVPEDPGSYRCDRLVGDVEALRERLGLDRLDLLAHCAGANPAVQYASRHPERVGKLVLVTPSVRAVGLTIEGGLRLETARLRRHEPWFPEAFAALEAIVEGRQVTEDAVNAVAPFSYGRWDEAAQAHHAALEERRAPEVMAAFGAEGAFDPDATRAALGRFPAPVLLLAGEVDLGAPPRTVAEFAGLFPDAEFVVQPGAGHNPWVDDAERFVRSVVGFLERTGNDGPVVTVCTGTA